MQLEYSMFNQKEEENKESLIKSNKIIPYLQISHIVLNIEIKWEPY